MIRAALKNPHLVIVLALAALVIGTESYRKIPADLLPIFDTPAVQIVTFYPGMPPEVMERDIMSRLERWTGQSVGIEHQEGKAMLGVSIVKDFFREGISLETAMSQVTSYAVSDMFYLPPGTIPPMVMPFDPTASVPLCLVSVSNLGMSEKELYDIAYFELRNRLQAIPGVIAPAVYGGKLRRILAYVEREKLEARGLSLMDVQRALVEQNVLIPAGSAKIGEVDYQVFTNSIPELVSSMNDTPLGVVDGAPVLLKDVGEVRDAGQIQTNIVRTNGARQVYIPIYRQPGANTIAIVDAITGRLDQILARLKEMNAGDPKMQGLILSVVMDQSIGVRKSIGDLQLAAGLGALLAGLVVLLFLRNLGMTLVIMLAIPLSILVAVIGLFFTGDTINAMTLGGLALAVGILVDQAIVVMENIVRHADLGKSPFDAALDGAKEVAMPIFVSTVTFVVVFYPVVFLSGLARFLFTPLAVAASVAIIGSYLVALTLVPAYCARFLRRTAAQRDVGSNAAGGFYDRVLGFLLRRRRTTVLAALALLAGAILMLPALGTELFPQVDPGQFTLTVRLPAGTRIERTEEMVAAIERSLIQEIGPPDPGFALGAELHPESDLQILISNIGVLMDWPAAYTPNVGPMDAFILVQLKGKAGHGTAFDLVQRLRRRLSSEFPAAEFAFDTGGMMSAALNFGEPSPIHFQVTGSKLDVAQSIARVIARVARDVAGAEDVRIAQRQDYPILEFEIDRALAATQGVSTSDVMKNLVSATNSSINFEPAFWIDQRNGNHYFMGVQYHEQDIESLEALRNIPITGRDSVRPVLLRNVATMKPKLGPSVINHHNITRATDVYVNVRAGFATGSVAAEIEKRLAREPDLGVVARATEEGRVLEVGGPDYAGKGYLIEMQGEVRDMRESFAQFAAGLLIAVILVYLVMVAQFRSFVDPLVILLTVPLGFIGVVAALWATDTALSIMVFMGIIMMVGIVVEYSIVLVHFANQRLAEGAAPAGAIAEAARVRLRPILMTSATTVLALLPMAIGLGGGGANVPLARTIVGGVISATILALLVVPCLYVMGKGTRRRALPLPHLGLCLLIPASGLACERPENATTGTRAEAASTAEPAPLVDTLAVRAEDLAWTVIVPGSVQAIEAADLFGKLGGYLERVAVDIGDQVEAGQTLATIRVPEMLAESRAIAAEVELTRRLIAQESAAVARAEAAVATAETELPRLAALRREKEAELALRRVELERLVQLTTEAKSIELRRVDEARFRFEAAEAALALAGAERPAADARIGEAQAAVMKARADRRVAEARLAAATADLATQSELLAYATIRAPFAGIITERHLHAGAFVRPATTNGAALPVLRIERIDQVRVSAHIAMDSLASLEVGDRVVFDGIQAAPELRLEGAISRLEGALDPRSRMMRIEADFSNPADGAGARRLRPGFYGQLTIILEDYPETPTVPAAAVFTRDGTDFVFTVEDGIARLRPISILFQDGGRVGIEAGVAVGQQVVAQRVATLQDGQRVRTKPLGAAVR